MTENFRFFFLCILPIFTQSPPMKVGDFFFTKGLPLKTCNEMDEIMVQMPIGLEEMTI